MWVNTTKIVTNSGKFYDKEVIDFTGHKSNIYGCVSQQEKWKCQKELNKTINKTKDQVEQQTTAIESAQPAIQVY